MHATPYIRFAGMILVLLVLTTASSCRKDQWDDPPDSSAFDPMLPVDYSIKDFIRVFQNHRIDTAITLSGIVVMNDHKHNIYHKLIIQDSSSGLVLLIDRSNLYNDFPTGRKVYIRAQGLFLSVRNGVPQLGIPGEAVAIAAPIPTALLDKVLVKASYPHPVIPDTISVEALRHPDSLQRHLYTVIALKNMEFAFEDAGLPYADPATTRSSTDRMIENCNADYLFLRTSAYADFRLARTPGGRGTVTGVLTREQHLPYLLIRDTGDVQFSGARCANGQASTLIHIDSLRKIYVDTPVLLPAVKIRGVVISDRSHGNVSEGCIVLQEGTTGRGITLYYGGVVGYQLGDVLEVSLRACTLVKYQGKLEVSGVTKAATRYLAADSNVTPRQVTIDQLLNAPDHFESTLVTITQVWWPATATIYDGECYIADSTAAMLQYCGQNATFRYQILPPSPTHAVTGYIDNYNGNLQLRIRNPNPPVNDVMP